MWIILHYFIVIGQKFVSDLYLFYRSEAMLKFLSFWEILSSKVYWSNVNSELTISKIFGIDIAEERFKNFGSCYVELYEKEEKRRKNNAWHRLETRDFKNACYKHRYGMWMHS